MTMYETSKSPATIADAISCRKSKMAYQLTGSSNISETMKHITKIPTATPRASPAFSIVAIPNNVAKWLWQWPTTGNGNVAPKPEIVISLEMWHIRWQFQRQIWGFRPRLERRNWPRVTTTDNRKWQCRRFGRQSCNFCQSIVVAIIWLIFYRVRHHRKSRIWRWNFDAICQSSRDVIISGLGAISILSVAVVLTFQHYFPPIRCLKL